MSFLSYTETSPKLACVLSVEKVNAPVGTQWNFHEALVGGSEGAECKF
jgi:hypothetical protein